MIQESTYLLRNLILHLRRSVGVGAEGKPDIVVPLPFYIHVVLEAQIGCNLRLDMLRWGCNIKTFWTDLHPSCLLFNQGLPLWQG